MRARKQPASGRWRWARFRYRHVRDLLANNRDLLPLQASSADWTSPAHANLRGPDYYQ